jgi:hypothetical protein
MVEAEMAISHPSADEEDVSEHVIDWHIDSPWPAELQDPLSTIFCLDGFLDQSEADVDPEWLAGHGEAVPFCVTGSFVACDPFTALRSAHLKVPWKLH